MDDTISDYDPCDECKGLGGNYYYDDCGDIVSNCYHCPMIYFYAQREDE